MKGILYVVATPIGNLNDITIRALDVLRSVDLIACEDTRQTLKLLNHYDIKKKLTAYHKFNEIKKSESLINDLKKGLNIAVVTDAGTPCISDPGYILIREARLNGIDVIGIPGASACVTSLSISGIDTSNFVFVGFLPTDNKGFNVEIEKIKCSNFKTYVIYESPKRLVKLVEKLKNHFENANVYIASDLTKIHERGFFGSIDEVYNEIKNDPNIEKGEYVIVLEKGSEHIEENNALETSVESKLVDVMINEKCTLKDAINILSKDEKLKKNDIYNASLKLKEIFKR